MAQAEGGSAAIATCSRCSRPVVAASRVEEAPGCPSCLTAVEMVRFGEPLHGRLLAEFQRRYRSNPGDQLLDEIFAVIEKVDRRLQDARLSAHLGRWGAGSYQTAA